MTRFWRFGAVAVLTVALATISSLGSAIAQTKGTIYYLVPTLLDEFQTGSIDAIEKFMGDVGYEVVSLDGQNRSDLQLNQVDDVLNLDPAAVIVAAVDFDAIKAGIEKLRAAGIPVMIFDRQITSTPSDLTSVAGTVEIGHIAADETVRLLTEKHGSPKGKVLPSSVSRQSPAMAMKGCAREDKAVLGLRIALAPLTRIIEEPLQRVPRLPRNADMPGECGLAQADLHPARSEPASDVSVDLVGRCAFRRLIDPRGIWILSRCCREHVDPPAAFPSTEGSVASGARESIPVRLYRRLLHSPALAARFTRRRWVSLYVQDSSQEDSW